MTIKDFTLSDIPAASALARGNYLEECEAVGSLPKDAEIPDMSWFAENGLGVAAYDGDRLVGFIICCAPWDNAFDTVARGTFVPSFCHGAKKGNRKKLYRLMYQRLAEKLVADRTTVHCISLYAHDTDAVEAFFGYGFGVRCMDAMRDMSTISTSCDLPYEIRLATRADEEKLLPLRKALSAHFCESPIFMVSKPETDEEWAAKLEKRQTTVFAVFDGEKPIAYMETGGDGETFASGTKGGANICGAYCLPEYRGKNIPLHIINYMLDYHRERGITRLGVDFESYNPTAYGFWCKYFDVYTNSVVRRIDEGILDK